jgi:outer membrane protein assembly factor BamB
LNPCSEAVWSVTCNAQPLWLRARDGPGLLEKESQMRSLLSGVLLGVCAVGVLAADLEPLEWPSLRGPDGVTGVAPKAAWLTTLDTATKLWEANVGQGYSSVVVADGKALTMGNAGKQTTVLCVEAATGKEVWRHAFPSGKTSGAGSSSTPTVEKDKAYVLGSGGTLLCLDLAKGGVVWQRNLAGDHQLQPPQWAFAGSPTVFNSLLVVNVGGRGLAVDKASGKTVWSTGASGAGYATVIPYTVGNVTKVLVFTAKELVAVNPVNGQRVWGIPWKTGYDVNASAPIPIGQAIFVASGYGTGSALVIDQGATAAVSWRSKVQTQLSGGVHINGYVYAVSASKGTPGELHCVDLKTGKSAWSRPGFGQGSLIGAGDKLLVLSDKGMLCLVQADPSAYKELSRKKLLDGQCWTPPTIAAGRIYARNSAGLVVCYGVK